MSTEIISNNDTSKEEERLKEELAQVDVAEEIFKVPFLCKEIEELKEDKEEYDDEELDDNLSERDKVTEEILNNKFSFNEKSLNKIKLPNLEKDLIQDLFIELFEYHLNENSSKDGKMKGKILETKCHIEFFCTKFNKNFCKYLLFILDQKIEELMDIVENHYVKKSKFSELLEIKKSLELTGKDISLIFEKPFKKTKKFDVSSILIVAFFKIVLGIDDIELKKDECEILAKVDSGEENDKFEEYIRECKASFEEEEGKEDDEEEDMELLEEEFNRMKLEEKKRKLEEKKQEEEKINSYTNIEDLVKYINGNDNKKKNKKKRKKRRKNKKVEKVAIVEKEVDQVFEDFKANLKYFSDNLINCKKIIPNLSPAFLEKLNKLNF